MIPKIPNYLNIDYSDNIEIDNFNHNKVVTPKN